MTDKPDWKRRLWGTSERAVIALAAIYVLSVGPAFRVADRTGFIVIYRPLFWVIDNSPEPLRVAGVKYVQFWADVTRPSDAENRF
jgi:hypothetical protein